MSSSVRYLCVRVRKTYNVEYFMRYARWHNDQIAELLVKLPQAQSRASQELGILHTYTAE